MRSKTWITSLFLWITIFQSTCSVRSKTHANQLQAYYMPFQSSCSVRSKTAQAAENERLRAISIHLLRAEQDFPGVVLRAQRQRFQSTCSVRSKTKLARIYCCIIWISIHLLRAEQDGECGARAVHALYFNPLAPCGARQQTVIKTVCKGRSYCTDHLLISPTKGTFSRKKNHPDGKTAYLWCEPIRDLV